ncbi:MAG TPA: RsmE family RNA methyltransferase [Acidimicrobiia bacterium]|nr:RsmE family RNA methyltransferase [Acidimicrobiia bacterium]
MDKLKDELVIAGDDHHHLTRVMRLSADDLITAAHEGNVREYKVSRITREVLEAVATRSADAVHEPQIDLAVSLFALNRLETGIAKAVEAGATSLTFGATSRSSITLDAEKHEKFLRRAEAIVHSAVIQSRRASKVAISIVDDLTDYCFELSTPLVVCDPDGVTSPPSAPVTILIGPEGGFDGEERELLAPTSSTWCISPYILRSETAMSIAPALISAAFH